MNTQVVNFSNHELRVIENQAQKWFCARDKDTLEFRRLHAENDRLVAENADLKNRMSQISSWIK